MRFIENVGVLPCWVASLPRWHSDRCTTRSRLLTHPSMQIHWNLQRQSVKNRKIRLNYVEDSSWEKDRCHTQDSHLPLPGQLPLHSGWSRCCKLPICTELPKLTEFPSAPEEPEKRLEVWLPAVDEVTLYPFLLQLTAVWAVMWVQPTTLAPARGFSPWALFRRAIRAGISKRGDGNKSAESLRNSRHLIRLIHL